MKETKGLISLKKKTAKIGSEQKSFMWPTAVRLRFGYTMNRGQMPTPVSWLPGSYETMGEKLIPCLRNPEALLSPNCQRKSLKASRLSKNDLTNERRLSAI